MNLQNLTDTEITALFAMAKLDINKGYYKFWCIKHTFRYTLLTKSRPNIALQLHSNCKCHLNEIKKPCRHTGSHTATVLH